VKINQPRRAQLRPFASAAAKRIRQLESHESKGVFAPMSSAAQVSANRANAQLSTGPQTGAGLAAIVHNNFHHGLASAFVVLPSENHAAYDDLLLNLNLEFSPSTETEEIIVTAMAQHHWLRARNRLLARRQTTQSLSPLPID
jgi:hypothetical protein